MTDAVTVTTEMLDSFPILCFSSPFHNQNASQCRLNRRMAMTTIRQLTIRVTMSDYQMVFRYGDD